MKKVIFMLAAAATVASCSKTDVIDNPNADSVLIQAKPRHQLVDGSVTRAPFDGNIAIDNKLEARVLTFKAAALYANGLMDFSNTTDPVAYTSVATAGTDKFNGAGTDTYTMYGLYPEGWDVTTPVTPTIPFDGSIDVMATAAATTSEAGVKGGTYPSLIFKHQLTKLVVKVQAMDDAAITTWGNLTAITLTELMGSSANVHNIATYNLSADNMAFTKSGADPMSFWVVNSAQVFTDVKFAAQAVAIQKANPTAANIVPVAYSMVAPFTPANNKDITLSVTTTTKTNIPVYLNVKTLPANVTTAGYAYTITLTFTDAQTIVATAEVTDWIDGGEVGGVVM